MSGCPLHLLQRLRQSCARPVDGGGSEPELNLIGTAGLPATATVKELANGRSEERHRLQLHSVA